VSERLIQKLRSAGEAERTLSPASGLFDEAADEIIRLSDIIAEFGMGERIVAAAHLHKLDNSTDPRAVPAVVSAPPPARHHNLYALNHEPDESGFLTSTGRFVDRAEALQIALAAGQPMIDHPSRHDEWLFSEDLW
jgi:hypothetical protein